MPDLAPQALLAGARAGDRRALARLLSVVERDGVHTREAAALVFATAGEGRVVGITGAPGAGKSSLIAALIGHRRNGGERVAVLAVDPSSPLSGGAVLGDRVRMQAHAADEGVFVRSMASRGVPGGLAPAVPDAVRVFDAAGWPWVLVETVGVGQSDVDVRLVADTVVVVVNPGWGDDVQVEKAGLLEIADIVVVNKADRPGADQARAVLDGMLDLVPTTSGWRPPVVATSAIGGRAGVGELWAAIDDHQAWLGPSGLLSGVPGPSGPLSGDPGPSRAPGQEGRRGVRRRARLADELRWLVDARAGRPGLRRCSGPKYDEAVAAMATGRLDPRSAADAILGAPGEAGGN
ncbi:MAG: methylmalonyl Co-A mutase-associated GTPase MeaB [Actinomycetota bacterium]|nr:methylmalonyl Co-A mutase-associated GTPase MeaB [Actinomycetota bacterium]